MANPEDPGPARAVDQQPRLREQSTDGGPPALRPLARLGLALAAWGGLFLATPGVLLPGGSALLAALAVGLWGLVCSRPGRRAFLVEWLAGAVGLGAQMWWIAYVFAPALLWVGGGMGLYAALGGALLRRLARRFPLALAVPAAWIGAEALRAAVPPPFGLGWQLLGHHLADDLLVLGSARVWGVGGLGWVLAAAGGALAGLARRRSADALVLELPLGLAPLVAAVAIGRLVPAPETRPGPFVLLVQPAFPQERKQTLGDPRELFLESRELTRRGTSEASAHGYPGPDLVAWGETMLYLGLADEGLRAAVAAGATGDPWLGSITPRLVDAIARDERLHVRGELFGEGDASGILPGGTSFLSGAELLVAHAGRVRRQNALALWTERGARRQLAAKRHLVPGAETMLGLERFAFVRDTIFDIAGYVPDFLPAAETAVLELPTAAGPTWRFSATVCFDNAFTEPYTAPLRRGPVDFHLVCSNEAWYLESCEMDQMVAFSRVLAAATGRALVRACNAGISSAFGPDGSELARLTVDGRDRLVPGTLMVRVPVPVGGRSEDTSGDASGGGEEPPTTPFVRTEKLWTGLWLALPLLLLAGTRARRRNHRERRG